MGIFQVTEIHRQYISWVCQDTHAVTSKSFCTFHGIIFEQPKFTENLFPTYPRIPNKVLVFFTGLFSATEIKKNQPEENYPCDGLKQTTTWWA